ncbi:MAG TPA: hypothetical protein VMV34_05355, partial [Terriglobia bacterium]|nr:hypothetical protein [Terriglobia bacterium]
MLDAEADRKLDKIGRRLDELYLGFRKPEPALPARLFHFTDPQGTVGVVSSGRLWASNADYLNDSSEPVHALKVLKSAFQEVLRNLRPGSVAERALSGCWDWAMNEYGTQGPHVYVFCFSEHDDLLSQWRSYGAEGAGYALGFSAHGLLGLARAAEGQYLLKITYDEGRQKQEGETVFKKIVSVVEDAERTPAPIDCTPFGDTTASRVDHKLRTAVLAEIIRLRAKFKAPAFQEE